jgi:hypothetical protein
MSSSGQLVFDLPPDQLPSKALMTSRHYLGPAKHGEVYRDEFGVMVFANPASRRLPHDRWLELSRWCLLGEPNAGSRQWARARRWIAERAPEVTTVVSYSDPGFGHTGALYRACGWLWAPTWLRLRPPPSGNGSWGVPGQVASLKDRWIYPLGKDPERESILAFNEAKRRTGMAWAIYREPKWRRGRPLLHTGGGDYRRWVAMQSEAP